MQPISEEVLIVSQCQWRHRPEPSVKQLWYFRHKKKVFRKCCSDRKFESNHRFEYSTLPFNQLWAPTRKSIIQLWVDATPIIFVKKYFICERDFFLYWKHKNAKYLDLDWWSKCVCVLGGVKWAPPLLILSKFYACLFLFLWPLFYFVWSAI